MTIQDTASSTSASALADDATIEASGNTLILKNSADKAQGDIFYIDANAELQNLPAGTSGYFLKTQGAGANPTWDIAPNNIELIGTYTQASDANTLGTGAITTTSYKKLIVEVIGLKVSSANGITLTFNADTGANYNTHGCRASTTTLTAQNYGGLTYIPTLGGANWSTSVNGGIIFEVSNTASLSKIFKLTSNSTTNSCMNGGYWNNTADQITSILLTGDGGVNIIAGAVMKVWGVK